MPGFTPRSKELLRDAGCYWVRHGKGDLEIWFSPLSGVNFPVDSDIRSRHTANQVLKLAELPKSF